MKSRGEGFSFLIIQFIDLKIQAVQMCQLHEVQIT